MGLFSRLLNEFIDVIEWIDTSHDTLIWKFPRQDNAIKSGAKLTVRESQMAIFMNEGQIADVFGPGMYELTTHNLPVLTTLESWKYAFNSPFKADVYFVSTRQFINQRWGTQNPVMVRDAEFGPVRLRAFGSYSFRVQDARQFLKEIAATNPNFSVEDVSNQLRNVIVSRAMDAVAAAKIPVLDLTSSYDELGKLINEKIQPEFAELGLQLTKMLVENISLPPEVEQVLDKRSEMGILGNLGAYAHFQAANALEKSAENSVGGNLGAAGMGLGAGMAMTRQMGNLFQENNFNPNPDVPPPLNSGKTYFIALNGKSDGPHSIEQLNKLALASTFSADTMVWTKGMAAWAAAGTLPELAEVLSQIPPPLA